MLHSRNDGNRWLVWTTIGTLAALTTAGADAQRLRVGETVEERYETLHPYPTRPGKVLGAAPAWRDEIHSPGATYIAVHFDRFELAPGDRVVVRSPGGEQSWTYTGLGKAGLGRGGEGFYAGHVKGDIAIVELFAQPGNEPAWGYSIDGYARGYSQADLHRLWDAGLGEVMNLPRTPLAKAICGTDDSDEAICYETTDPEIYTRSRAVARLLVNGTGWCTGWLVGRDGHVMTNEHCITSQTEADNTDFELMAEGSNCATDCTTGGDCDGTVVADRATLIEDDAGLDYALVLPDTTADLAATYGYLRLRGSGPALNERIYLPGHPNGWGKRISVESSHPVDSTGFAVVSSVNEPACDDSGPDGQETGYYADTDYGSSGSPVLGHSDHKVVALHHCRGDSSCTSTGGDRNRGIPIDLIIADLGSELPTCSVEDVCKVSTPMRISGRYIFYDLYWTQPCPSNTLSVTVQLKYGATWGAWSTIRSSSSTATCGDRRKAYSYRPSQRGYYRFYYEIKDGGTTLASGWSSGVVFYTGNGGIF